MESTPVRHLRQSLRIWSAGVNYQLHIYNTTMQSLEIRHDGYHSPSPVDADLACRPGVSDADVGADRAPRCARTGAPRPAWRGAHGGRGTDPAVFRRHRGSHRDCPALRRHGGTRGRPATGAVYRRGHHALGSPRDRPHTRGKDRRSDPARPPATAPASCRRTAKLREIVMRAFILRRVELLANGIGDVVLIGARHGAGTLRVKEFLVQERTSVPSIDLDTDPGVQELFDQFPAISEADIPVLICRCVVVLKNPTNEEIPDCPGFNESIDPRATARRVIIVGGRAGLTAAVYRGLRRPQHARGRNERARRTGWIEFEDRELPRLSERHLGPRTCRHALIQPGAEVRPPLWSRKQPLAVLRQKAVRRGDRLRWTRISARTIVIASGAQYRNLILADLARFEGAGVYYGATYPRGPALQRRGRHRRGWWQLGRPGRRFLAQTSKHVHVLVRSGGLAESMSRYLIRRIEDNPAIFLRCEHRPN